MIVTVISLEPIGLLHHTGLTLHQIKWSSSSFKANYNL